MPKKPLTKEAAYKMAVETLEAFKGLVSELNGFCVDYNLLPVETVTNPFINNSEPKMTTSILQISCECDEQLGLLNDASFHKEG